MKDFLTEAVQRGAVSTISMIFSSCCVGVSDETVVKVLSSLACALPASACSRLPGDVMRFRAKITPRDSEISFFPAQCN